MGLLLDVTIQLLNQKYIFLSYPVVYDLITVYKSLHVCVYIF